MHSALKKMNYELLHTQKNKLILRSFKKYYAFCTMHSALKKIIH